MPEKTTQQLADETRAQLLLMIREEVGPALAPTLEEIKKSLPDQIAAAFAKEVTPERIKAIAFTAHEDKPKRRTYGQIAAGVTLAAFDRIMGNPKRSGDEAEFINSNRDRLDLLGEQRTKHLALTGQTTSATAGGYLIPTEEILEPIDLVGAKEGILARCQNHTMRTGTLTIVTLDGDITITVVPETADASDTGTLLKGRKPETQFSFGKLTLRKYMLTAMVHMTRQEMMYSQGRIEQIVNSRLPLRFRKKFEALILRGTGAAPDYVSGLDTLVTGDNVIEWADAAKLDTIKRTIAAPEIALPEVAAADTCITNVRGILALDLVKDNQGRYILGDPSSYNKALGVPLGGAEMVYPLMGYPCLKSPNVLATYPAATGTDSRFYAGDFKNHMHIGFDEGGMFVLVDPYTLSADNLVRILYEIPVGMTVSSASAFAYTDIPRA